MLITKNNEKKRELVEQVQYLTDYHNQDKALASWGIRIVGQIESESELPAAETYTGEYGDTYAVGQEAPFNFYIFTRSSLAGSGDYWFPFGQISIAGPQGPEGVQGEKGDTGESSRWYVGSNVPQPLTTLYKPGDMYLNVSTGNVYEFTDNEVWLQVANITGPQGPRGPQGESIVGPQGPQGPKGERGDVAGLVNIRGQLTSTEQLPSPADLNNLTVAYLINGDLWIQFGENPQTATWNNVGPFNVGTMVTVNGVYQNVWDADTKAPAKSDKTGKLVVWASNGETSHWETIMSVPNAQKQPGIIATYGSAGEGTAANETTKGYLVSNNPVNPYHVATKNYVDNKVGQLHPATEIVFTYRIAIQPNEEVSMTYQGSQGLLNFRWMTISMDMGGGEYVTETLPISAISDTDSFVLWKTTYPSKFTIQIKNLNSPSPTMKLTNLTGRTNDNARLNVTCF